MVITSIDVRLVSIPLEHPYVFSRGSVASFDNIIVFVHTSSGLTGVGECIAEPLVADVGKAGRIIQDVLALRIVGKDPSAIESIIQDCRPYVGESRSTLAAIDLALWGPARQDIRCSRACPLGWKVHR
jgi:L-alanine-DL-glutamate epimerase-like enolase superfamily enzyme